MARTYAAVVIDNDAELGRWKLMRFFSSSVDLIRELRPRGFYANYATLNELEHECKRLSTFPDAEVDAGCRSSSDDKKRSNEQAAPSPPRTLSADADIISIQLNRESSRPLMRPVSPHVNEPKDSKANNWFVSVENGETVPIMEVPYADMSLSSAPLQRNFFLKYVRGKEQEQMCMPIQEWRFDLRADAGFAVFAKTTNQVWVELGKPEEHYEQTIRSVQVYMQLFSMVVTDSEVTTAMLFHHLSSKLNHWKVKPDVSDLDESLALIKHFNLNCLFPLERRVHSLLITEIGNLGDLDSENGGKPLTFQRARNRSTHMEPELEEVYSGNTVKTSSNGDEGTLILKHQTTKRIGTAATNVDLGDSLSQTRADSDHVLLSSKLHDLKKRKAPSQMVEDTDRIQKRETDSIQTCNFEVEPGNVKRRHTSSMGSDDYRSIQAFETAIKDKGTVVASCAESRVNEILKKTMRIHGGGSEHEYITEPFPTIRKLWNSTSMIISAIDSMEKGGSMDDVQSLCSVESLRNFYLNEVALREYGVSQFLPAIHRQKEVAERINYYAHDGDMVVEICSQSVDYISLLKERLKNMGKLCNYRRFFVDESQSQDLKDSINKEALPTGSKLLICLSLSFALRGERSNKIVDTALELKPKLIVLIAPLFSRRLDEHATYNLIWSDDELLQSEVIWPWGDLEVPINSLDKKKGISPTIFLWSRTDWATKHRQIASRFGHLKKSVPSSLRGQISTS